MARLADLERFGEQEKKRQSAIEAITNVGDILVCNIINVWFRRLNNKWYVKLPNETTYKAFGEYNLSKAYLQHLVGSCHTVADLMAVSHMLTPYVHHEPRY